MTRRHPPFKKGTQMQRVHTAMKIGGWHSLMWISMRSGVPPTTVGTRVRDLRKPECYEHIIERRRLRGGLHLYKMEERADG